MRSLHHFSAPSSCLSFHFTGTFFYLMIFYFFSTQKDRFPSFLSQFWSWSLTTFKTASRNASSLVLLLLNSSLTPLPATLPRFPFPTFPCLIAGWILPTSLFPHYVTYIFLLIPHQSTSSCHLPLSPTFFMQLPPSHSLYVMGTNFSPSTSSPMLPFFFNLTCPPVWSQQPHLGQYRFYFHVIFVVNFKSANNVF